ncbi:hypothetical protein CHX26_10955 [Porphyrobacter sp. HT-58-2]|uniref:copper chaperone PCu(A)C n=1 Tax=Porphyrobacter sp. HT-58-2 TaxID=2023229 RepID=UPI000CDBC6AF|nr:copper chaperone PCu(A)C [Porphyrobacter sp. HT-58-2]AUX69940.1 hypothetical protein CHX26_10955 [Porphyrobacter sp. HT-58-2]
MAALALPALVACAPDAEAPIEADAAKEATSESAGLTVSNPRVVLAPVSGNPAAVYFDLSYSGSAPVTLTGVAVEGAGMTMIHDYAESAGKMAMTMAGPVSLAEGTPVTFAPGGLHVMAMDPGSDLKPGAMAKVTLTLSDGTTQTVEAPVRAAGEDR